MSEVLENEPGPLTGELAAKIKRALTTELSKSSYQCRWNVANGPGNMATGHQMILVLNHQSTQIFVSSDLNQPLIRTVTKEKASVEVVVLYTTTPDFKKLTQIEATKNILSQVTQNTGTLIDPKFETVTVSTPDFFGFCSVK